MLLDLTFVPSFKVKRWFTGFGELSFRWTQICIGSAMRKSSMDIEGSNDTKQCAKLNGKFSRFTRPAAQICYRSTANICQPIFQCMLQLTKWQVLNLKGLILIFVMARMVALILK